MSWWWGAQGHCREVSSCQRAVDTLSQNMGLTILPQSTQELRWIQGGQVPHRARV